MCIHRTGTNLGILMQKEIHHESILRYIYSLCSILIESNIDVSSITICLDTSVLESIKRNGGSISLTPSFQTHAVVVKKCLDKNQNCRVEITVQTHGQKLVHRCCTRGKRAKEQSAALWTTLPLLPHYPSSSHSIPVQFPLSRAAARRPHEK